MRDSASLSCALAICFWVMSDLMMRMAFCISSSENRGDSVRRSLASSMFLTVIPVA